MYIFVYPHVHEVHQWSKSDVWVVMFQHSFPDNTYGVDSGGDPTVIPDLTFEQFKVRCPPSSLF